MAENPFKSLRDRLEAKGKTSAPKPAAGPAPKPVHRATAEVEEDDSDLFLQSVAVMPLNKRGRGASFCSGEETGSPLPLLKSMPAKPKSEAPGSAETAPIGPHREHAGRPGPEFPPSVSSTGKLEPALPQAGSPTGAPIGDDSLFSKAMQGVAPIAARGRDVHTPAEPAVSGPASLDAAEALRDLLDGKIEFAVRHTEEYIEGFVAGLDPMVFNKLRSGSLSPEAHLDLHGKNARQALDSLILFIKNAYQRSMRTVLVVTGRGRNSPEGIGIIRLQLQEWLTRDPFKRVVLAFCTAQPHDGGPGAVYVLLRRHKKGRGKIVWERGPLDEEIL